jgi:hypothetical protein
MTENNNSSEKDFFPESKENIIEGAKIFSEKASEIFNTFMGKVKETAVSAYEKGSEIVEMLALKAQEYIEKYKDRSEMASLKKLRDEVASKLGQMCYIEYDGRYRFRAEFTKSDEFKELIAQMRELDNSIIKIGERLDQE